MATAGTAPVRAAALAEGVMKTMTATRAKTVVAFLLAAGTVAGGGRAGAAPGPGRAGRSGRADGPTGPPGKAEPADDFAWGPAVDGLQAGLAVAGTPRVGEAAALRVRVPTWGG